MLTERLRHLNRQCLIVTGEPAMFHGASESEIQDLLDYAGGTLPPDYLDFLRLSNGFLSDLENAQEVIRTSRLFSDYLPGALMIGGDGESRLILDMRGNAVEQMTYRLLPDERMSWETSTRHWLTFTEMFLDLYPEGFFGS